MKRYETLGKALQDFPNLMENKQNIILELLECIGNDFRDCVKKSCAECKKEWLMGEWENDTKTTDITFNTDNN